MSNSSRMPKRVSVTGANGFVGTALCKSLEANSSYDLHRLLRQDGFELHNAHGDVWRKGFAGSEICIHLASVLPWGGNNFKASAEKYFLDINAFAARTLLRAFHAEGGRHFVFLSTIGVNGVSSGESAFTPHDKPAATGNYSRSKLLAEQLLEEDANRLDVKLTIIRPPVIYGAGVQGSFGKLVHQIANARILPYADICNHRDMIGLGNLVDLIVAILDQETVGTFLIKDRDPVSTTWLVQAIMEGTGSEARLLSVPRPLRAVLRQLPLIGGIARRIFDDVRIDDSDFARINSWKPRYSVLDELHKMFPNDHGTDVCKS